MKRQRSSMKKQPKLYLVTTLALMAALLVCGCATQQAPADESAGAGRAIPSTQPTDDYLEGSAMRVTCIDVEKGDCLLIQVGGMAALIDTGYQGTVGTVLDTLQGQGISKLDAIVLTHFDRDHVGGLRSIAGSVSVRAIYLPGYEGADKNYESTIATARDLGLTTRLVTREQRLELGTAQLVIHPSAVSYVRDANGDEGNDNDASLVVALKNGSDSYLFAGDLEEEGIEAYLADDHGEFDVLKMPHHGEKSDNIGDMLDDVHPQIALITDSADDPADKKTLKLLKRCGVDTYRTSVDGTIVVESDGDGSYRVTSDNGS